MKKCYLQPSVEITLISTDVICTSNFGADIGGGDSGVDGGQWTPKL